MLSLCLSEESRPHHEAHVCPPDVGQGQSRSQEGLPGQQSEADGFAELRPESNLESCMFMLLSPFSARPSRAERGPCPMQE